MHMPGLIAVKAVKEKPVRPSDISYRRHNPLQAHKGKLRQFCAWIKYGLMLCQDYEIG